jgi:uncharacterized heparinase superfamily protein
MPVEKLAARVSLYAKRQVLSRAGSIGKQSISAIDVPPLAVNLPQKVFGGRGNARRLPDGSLELHLLNCTERYPGTINWHDPKHATGTRLWKLNQHYTEFVLDLEPSDAIAICRDWIAKNPPFRRDYWRDSWNSFAISNRVVIWMKLLASLPRDVEGAAELLGSLVQQLRFLERNLENDIGGNHVIKNIKALAWAGAFFAGAEADRWRSLALRLLAQELDRQILPDGVHYERTPSYHAQVLADLAECHHVLGGDPLSGRLDRALRNMAQAVVDLAHPDGAPAMFNDAGLNTCYSPAECCEALHRMIDFTARPRTVFDYPEAGYWGARSQNHTIIVDCGPIAPDDLPAHGHGDVLSFEWSVGDRRFIVDQGVYEYSEGERRERSRAASSHNTLCFEGADQAEFFAAFRCGRRPKANVRSYEPRANGFVLEGAHDGFANLPGQPIHVRRFEVDERSVRIIDSIEGTAPVAAKIAFLLHPEVKLEKQGGKMVLTREGERATIASSVGVTVEDAVWWPDFGVEIPTHRIVLHVEPTAPATSTVLEVV